MISLLFITLSAICNAICDNIKDHWYKSIFNRYNPKFWNPAVSWIIKPIRYTGYKLDSWHIFKSGMIIFLCFGIVFYKPIFNWYFDIIILSTLWNLTFDIFYSKLLNKN